MVNGILDVDQFRGKLIVETGCMKGGKTEALIAHAQRVSRHSKYSLTVFTSSQNTRDGFEQIASASKTTFPALPADSHNLDEILETIHKRDKERFQDVIILDEGNFYDHRIIPFTRTLRREARVVIVGGVDLNFRGEPFGPMAFLKMEADQLNVHYAYCQIVHQGERCSKPARYTTRLLKRTNPHDQHLVDFARDDDIIRGQYHFAPYYHPTILPEEPQKKAELPKRVYTIACPDCFKIPGKEETQEVYDALKTGMNDEQLASEFRHIGNLNLIIDFLVGEKRIQRQGSRLLPLPYQFDMHSGMYVPI
ncbi:hypothetical protein HZB00_01525 [Candidatus Woesearchaeota archaeon]|nr:hypothetical protein [Candidatus Woesearchaeota archaeon]